MPRQMKLEQWAEKRGHCLQYHQLRDIVDLRKAGAKTADIAKRFGFSESAVRRAPARLARMAMERVGPKHEQMPLPLDAPVPAPAPVIDDPEQWQMCYDMAYRHWNDGTSIAEIAADAGDTQLRVLGRIMRVLHMCENEPERVPERVRAAYAGARTPRQFTRAEAEMMLESRLNGASLTMLAQRFKTNVHSAALQLEGLLMACVQGCPEVPERIRHLFLSKIKDKDGGKCMVYGRNVALRHARVAAIVVTVYVEIRSDTLPVAAAWVREAVLKLRAVVAPDTGLDPENWVLISLT